MKKLLLFAISILLTANCFSQSPSYLWAKQQDGGGTASDEARCVATDANGNILVTGRFYSSTITFGTTTLTNAGFDDMFVVKYGSNGNALWAKNQDAGGTGGGNGLSVVADASGNVIVTGYFYDSTITFGTTTLTNLGSADIVVVKYDPNGNVLWAKQQDAGGDYEDVPNSITTDADGNIIITGGFLSNSITFGTTTLTNADDSTDTRDIFIVKYDPDGNVLWAKQQDAGGSNADNAWGVAADANGNLFVTGHFLSPTITFGTTTLTNAASPSSNDIFIVKYDPNGNVLWAKQQDAGGSNSEAGRSVAVDASGNIIVTGNSSSPALTFGTTTLGNAGSNDIFIVKYDTNGNVLWAKQQDAGGIGDDAALSIATDANENVLVTGSFVSPTITFGSTTLTNANSANIYSDIFIVKYGPNGNVLWAKKQTAGGLLNDVAKSVATDSSGNIIVAGFYTARSYINLPRPAPAITITFGTTVLGTSTSGTSAGNQNIFIVKLNETITGIENNTLNNAVSVYPNPTTGLLFLSNNYNVTLSDLTGKIITKEQNTNVIDISNQPAGMYFLLLTDNKGQIVQRSKVTKE